MCIWVGKKGINYLHKNNFNNKSPSLRRDCRPMPLLKRDTILRAVHIKMEYQIEEEVWMAEVSISCFRLCRLLKLLARTARQETIIFSLCQRIWRNCQITLLETFLLCNFLNFFFSLFGIYLHGTMEYNLQFLLSEESWRKVSESVNNGLPSLINYVNLFIFSTLRFDLWNN